MLAERHIRRSVVVAAALSLFAADTQAAQEVSVQRLLERGALNEATAQAERDGGNPESTYLAAQAFIKMDNTGGANQQFGTLRERGDASWQAIGESGAEMLSGNLPGAMEAANRAVAANGGNPYAHYQLGSVALRQNNHQRAAEAFGRAAQLKGDLAYAHYYAGLAYQRIKQIPKMSEHLEIFMKLAPQAPERQTVASILRTLRG